MSPSTQDLYGKREEIILIVMSEREAGSQCPLQ